MAVQNSDSAQQAPAQSRSEVYGTAAPQQQGTNQADNAPRASGSFANFSGFNFGSQAATGPISKVLGSEDLAKLREKIEKIFGSTPDKGFSSWVIPVDGQNYYSSIVVAMNHASDPSKVAYFTLVMEATNTPPTEQTDTYLQQQIKVLRTVSTVYDKLFVQRVDEILRNAFAGVDLFNAGSLAIPRDFDTTNDVAVQGVAHEISFANVTELAQQMADFQDFTLAAAKGDTNLVADLRFNRSTVFPVIGHPVRSDIQVNFSTENKNTAKRNVSLNEGASNESFGRVNAYMDAVWDPAQQSTTTWGATANNSTQVYRARMVITEVVPEKLATLSAILLLIVSSTAITRDFQWINALRRDPRGLREKYIDRTDLGAYNIEANIERNADGVGVHTPTDPAFFDESDFVKAVQMMFHPDILFSLDISSLAPKGWALETLKAAAHGDKKAIEQIFVAANELTSGHFEKYFSLTDQMFVDHDNKIHMGYFTGPDGEQTDLRAIDQLAILNLLGAKDPGAGRRFSETFDDRARPESVRMAERLDMIEATCSNVVVTDIAERVTFHGKLIDALQRATTDAGLRLQLRAPTNNAGYNQQRASAGYGAAGAVSGAGASGLFGVPGYQGNNNGGGSAYDQYSRYR